MSPFVCFQEEVIRVLRRMNEKNALFLFGMVRRLRESEPKELTILEIKMLEEASLSPRTEKWMSDRLVEIILEQVDEVRPTTGIRNILGSKLYDYGPPMDIAKFARTKGGGICRLRTSRLAQPGALKEGDVLATGCRLLHEPREGGNGNVLLHLTGGTYGHWIEVPARIPVALLTEEDGAPPDFVDSNLPPR